VERPFRVDVVEDGPALVVAVFGELDIASSAALETELERGRDHKQLIVDLRGVDFIDSTGIGVLIRAHQRAEASGRRFAVVRGGGQVQRVLSLTGLADRLSVADTEVDLLSET
jgi:anti-sigma B factor antagonist